MLTSIPATIRFVKMNKPPEFDASVFEHVADVVKRRRTLKVLGDFEAPRHIDPKLAAEQQSSGLEALYLAGQAPFHYDRGADGIAELWRAYPMWHPQCRELAEVFHDWFPDAGVTNKLPSMLVGCGAHVLITWLPQFRDREVLTAAQVAMDDEHLAAASAMVQNLLLLLTAKNMGTYWSGGGQLGSARCFEQFGISKTEKLLAAVFIEYPEMRQETIERKPGKLRDARCKDWVRVLGV